MSLGGTTGSLRWRMALLIAAAIAISYFDRQTLPVAIKAIQVLQSHAQHGVPWIGLFRFPQNWGLMLGKFLSDAA